MDIIKSQKYKNSLGGINLTELRQLENKTILVTGATGMIGSCIIDTLSKLNEKGFNLKIIATSRTLEKLNQRFSPLCHDDRFIPIIFDASDNKQSLNLDMNIDYIIHAASYADPVNYAQYPIETMLSNIIGTKNLLEYGAEHGVKRFLFISSGEFYGQPDDKLSDFIESYNGPVDYSSARACYPSGKRAAEALCQSYISQKNMDCVIARPCHIFGPTMLEHDSRAISQFLQKSIRKEDILLKSAGNIERSHCYVVDCVNAILTVLVKGRCGEAYNISDKKYQMTIREFAEKICQLTKVDLVFQNASDLETRGYSTISRAVLDNTKLINLGWRPLENDGVKDTIDILVEQKLNHFSRR
ncbi:NAD-dependent epimerase/dehydratase family protein [Aminipila butyrica]|uniref:NAD-dependent epimerase/dehydratase family protein n=1 Tax=Aminipila butyrica TaxID=433296 RepID=A0A858BSU1_9FIRM|nr:NAD-dependent epimerase/dehydratase family protein [Aminipila butyrica]QIB68148.1 NAD-dependent epimerase/dehydratase family protein [Aminipila butyrica]